MKQRIVCWVWFVRVALLLILVPVLYIAMYGGLPDFRCTEGADVARNRDLVLIALLVLARLTPTRYRVEEDRP
jgi:hypothetical protein